jgi:hypothetical protein
MVIVRRLVLLAFAAAGLLVVATEPAHAVICEPKCCPWDVQAVAAAPGELPPGKPAPQYCTPQHCEPVLRH